MIDTQKPPPGHRAYQLVRAHNGSVVHEATAQNICAFAMECYRKELVLFGKSDVPRSEADTSGLKERAKVGPTAIAFRVKNTGEVVSIEHAKGRARILDETELGWWP